MKSAVSDELAEANARPRARAVNPNGRCNIYCPPGLPVCKYRKIPRR